MGLFDIFSFKTQAAKIFSTENIVALLTLAKNKIIEQAKEQIKGEEKKIIVDHAVIEFIKNKVKDCKNKIVLWLVDRLMEAVPKFTQLIYEFVKARIENL